AALSGRQQDRPALRRRRATGRRGHLSSDLHHLSAQRARHDAPDRQVWRRAGVVETHQCELDLRLSLGAEMNMKKLSLLTFVAAVALATSSFAQAPIEVHLKNHRFTPSVIKVKANQTAVIMLFND